MNRILVVFSDELLNQLDSVRHETARSAWIRRAVEERLAKEASVAGSKRKQYFAGVEYEAPKEAVAPLVPEGLAGPTHWSKGRLTDEDWKAFQEGAGFETPEETEVLDRMHGITPEATVGEIADALEAEKAKPKARRKKATVGDLESDEPIDLMTALKASVDAMKAATIQTPARCNRGACTGTINPVSGRCLHCNQTPLKES